MAGMLKHSTMWITLGGISTISTAYLARNAAYNTLLGFSKPGGIWRLLAIAFALLNLKSLPFGWHIRLLHSLVAHLSFRRNRPPKAPGPAKLFQPVITSSSTVFMDLDYNLHKSNSTYFLDLDISRSHLMACIFALGTHRAQHGMEGTGEKLKEPGVPESRAPVGLFLGAVTCNFRKELKPYTRFEIWSRILTWDRKWVYVISHIVRAGAVKPSAYTMQPWRRGTETASHAKGKVGAADALAHAHANGSGNPEGAAQSPDVHPAIIATSIAKYVFKRNRWTIPPEVAMQNSGLLPPRSDADRILLEAELTDLTDSNGVVWDWDRVEQERARGFEVAQHLAGLDGLMAEFSGDNAPVLGRW